MPNDSAQNNTQPLAGNKARIMEIRRRRRLRKLRATAMCVLAAALALAYFMGAFGTPLALLGDALDSVKIAMIPGTGFPVELSMTGYAASTDLSGGFAVMGGRELSVYSAHGNLLRRVPHGYARPCMTAGKSRVCLYSRGDTTLSVESRTRNLFTHTFEEPITLVEMSKNGTLAVFTKTTLEVFDPLFESVWAWKKSNEIPLAMAFADDNRRLAVATILPAGGGVGTTLHFFNIRSDKEQATTQVWNGTPVLMRHYGGKLLVVFDTFAGLYDTKSGAELARYDYGARLLQSADADSAGNVALLFGDAQYPGTTSAALLDNGLAQTAGILVGRAANTIALAHRVAYVLTDEALLAYGGDGALTSEQPLPTKPLAVLEARKALLVTADAVSELGADGKPAADAPAPSASDSATNSATVDPAASPAQDAADPAQNAAPEGEPSAENVPAA